MEKSKLHFQDKCLIRCAHISIIRNIAMNCRYGNHQDNLHTDMPFPLKNTLCTS